MEPAYPAPTSASSKNSSTRPTRPAHPSARPLHFPPYPALGYILNQWNKIHHCLSQGVLEIDTNLVENMIRPTKLGMKNWMFFGSLEAGTNNALIYTLLANCRAQDLDPEEYLVEVIKRLPPDATPEQAAAR